MEEFLGRPSVHRPENLPQRQSVRPHFFLRRARRTVLRQRSGGLVNVALRRLAKLCGQKVLAAGSEFIRAPDAGLSEKDAGLNIGAVHFVSYLTKEKWGPLLRQSPQP